MAEIMKKSIAELNFPEHVRYHHEHVWASLEGDVVRIGISDYAQDQLGDVIFVELPKVGDHFNRGEEFGVVESAKSVSTLYMAVSGKIVALNEDLEATPELMNKAPYGDGWIALVKPDERSKILDELLTCEAYKSRLESI